MFKRMVISGGESEGSDLVCDSMKSWTIYLFIYLLGVNVNQIWQNVKISQSQVLSSWVIMMQYIFSILCILKIFYRFF